MELTSGNETPCVNNKPSTKQGQIWSEEIDKREKDNQIEKYIIKLLDYHKKVYKHI